MGLFYYSTNSWLAYIVAERFFRQRHYVWCSPIFDHSAVGALDRTTPPSSSPAAIYSALAREVQEGDHHSAKIQANRLGIIHGATVKRKRRAITTKQYKDIVEIVTAAEIRDFRPLIYVIASRSVHKIIKEAPVRLRAHRLSAEYMIENLPRDAFDVIEVRV